MTLRLPATTLLLASLPLWGCAGLGASSANIELRNPETGGTRSPVAAEWRFRLSKHDFAPYNPEEFASAELSPDGRTAWIGSRDGVLWALRTDSGEALWRRKLGSPILARPLLVAARKLLYVGAADGCLHALSPSDGTPKWKYCTKGVIYRRPAYRLGVVYFANEQNHVFALDARTGKWRWSYDRDMPEGFTIRGHGGVLVAGDRLFAGFSDGFLVCLDARSGDVQWTRDLRGDAKEYVDVDSTPVLKDGVLYVTSQAGGVFAMTPELGALRWSYAAKGATDVVVTEERIYFLTARRGLHSLDHEGRLQWRQVIDGGAPTSPLVYEDLVIFGTSGSGLFFVDRFYGKFMGRFDIGYGVSARPSRRGTRLLVLENGGKLFGLKLY